MTSPNTRRLCLIGPLCLIAAPLLISSREPMPSVNASQDEDVRYLHSIELCARCHDPSPNSVALRAADSSDASPVGTFAGTVMQSAFIDPYFRAQLAQESRLAPEGKGPQLERECLRCHAPLVSFENELAERPVADLAQTLLDPHAREGVSCTACHRIGPEGLGTESTFNGHPPISREARLFGPYPEPETGPMMGMTGYEITYGPHMVESSLCATCHTLETHPAPDADGFMEQSPYLEWRNSAFSYEDEWTEESRSCQQCHMSDAGAMIIAHNPRGGDFGFLEERPEVRIHGMVGGNALLLDMIGANTEELGALATEADYARMAEKTREQLSGRTAELTLTNGVVKGDELNFSATIVNRTGHKLPTGYPSRRMWLEVTIESKVGVWFSSGVPDGEGRILPPEMAFDMPHHAQITHQDQIQIWERVATNLQGEKTTRVATMAHSVKDNRILPKGWRSEGPHADITRPIGIDQDTDFVGGQDSLQFKIPIPAEHAGRQVVRARLLFQTIPPAWADPFRGGSSPEEKRFVRMMDQAPTRFEVLGQTRLRIRN